MKNLFRLFSLILFLNLWLETNSQCIEISHLNEHPNIVRQRKISQITLPYESYQNQKAATDDESRKSSAVPPCHEKYLSCEQITISAIDLLTSEAININGETILYYVNGYVAGDSAATVWYSQDWADFAVFVTPFAGFPNIENKVFGQVHYGNGENYVVENCGTNCHMWMKGRGDREEGTGLDYDNGKSKNGGSNNNLGGHNEGDDIAHSIVGGPTSTVVSKFTNMLVEPQSYPEYGIPKGNHSIMAYYTPEFFEETTDLTLFFISVFVELNEVYWNSGVAMAMNRFCYTPASDLEERSGNKEMLQDFKQWIACNKYTRRTYDTTILLTNNGPCANAYEDEPGQTIAVLRKDCAAMQYSLPYTMGLMFGLDRDDGFNVGMKHRTIMKSPSKDHKYRIPAFSSSDPSITYMGYNIGNSDKNNAMELDQQVTFVSSIGLEDGVCPPARVGLEPCGASAIRTSVTLVFIGVLYHLFF